MYSLGEVDLPVTLMVTSDFKEIYKALQNVERKIPARILRYCKDQVYNLVRDTKPSEHLYVVDFEDLDESSNVDFVVGVGVKDRLTQRGYQAINLIDVFRDIVNGDGGFNADTLLSKTIKNKEKTTKYIPVYKYLKQQSIGSKEEYKNSKYVLRSVEEMNIKHFRNKQYKNFFIRECKGMNTQEIIEKYESDKAVILIPFIPWKDIDCETLKKFIIENIEKISTKSYSTYYRKLICVYDAIINGWYVKRKP